MPTAVSATVRHRSKDHVTITPSTGYNVIIFNLVERGDVEAIVAAEDGSETIRLLIAGPGANQTMSISTDEFGIVNIVYTTTPEA